MTICIGALCADRDGNASQAIVVASDRMVTLGSLIEFEHEVPKVLTVTENVVALIAGDATRGSRLVREVRAQLQTGSTSVEAITTLAANHYAQLRLQQIQNEIFGPRGINMIEFYQGLQQRLLPQLANLLDNEVVNFDYGVQLLIAGVDDMGAHLFVIANPGGTYIEFEQIGYHAIGSGTLHALQSMIGFGHTGLHDLDETIFTVYASKRRAEAASGVGRDTDLVFITKEGMRRVEQPAIAKLEVLYNDYQQPIGKDLRGKVEKLKLFEEATTDEPVK